MIAVCTKCGKAFETTEEDAYTPGVLCAPCSWRDSGRVPPAYVVNQWPELADIAPATPETQPSNTEDVHHD